MTSDRLTKSLRSRTHYTVKKHGGMAPLRFADTLDAAIKWINKDGLYINYDVYQVGPAPGRYEDGPSAKYGTYDRVSRVWVSRNNPRGRRMTRRTNPRAASRWGVYVKGNLAYVSNSKLDANKAASKLRLSGRTHITQKPVGPNPISGKVPVIGWRAEYKKAAYSAIKSPKVRRARARTTGKIRRTRERRGENPKRPKRQMDVFDKHQLKIAQDTLKMPDAMVGIMGGPNKTEAREIIKRIEAKYKRNPRPRRTVAGPSARAVAGRIGRSVGARVRVNPRGRGRDAGIGTRSVAKGGRLRNAAFTHVPYSRIKKGETFVGGSLWEKLIKVSATKALTEYGEYVTLSANQIVGKLKRSNPRRRNAASVLRRRSNPEYVLWDPIQKDLYRAYGQGTYGAQYTFPSKAEADKTAAIINRQTGRTGSTRLSVITRAVARGRRKHNPRSTTRRTTRRTVKRTINPRKGYVVQVGESVAWVGKLATDAQKAMKKLIDSGYKSVKGFQAKLLGAKPGWRKQYRRAATVGRKSNPHKQYYYEKNGPRDYRVYTVSPSGGRGDNVGMYETLAQAKSAVNRLSRENPRRNPSFGKGKLGSGSRFRKCVSTMKRRGVKSPAGLCASIGRRKYGAKRMAGMARKGMRRRSNPPKFYRIAYTMPSGKRHVGLISANDLADATQYYKRVMLREFPDGRGGTKASRLTIRRARGTEIPKQYR